jgi:adenosylcobyric acid synthase
MDEKTKKKGMKAACIAVMGTGSDVGKSIVTTALCRVLSDRGFKVAPFKAQNMSNNSGVTPEGLEMGRAQVVQAEAARQAPHVDMNPVLLKPTSDVGSQVILNGSVWRDASPKAYYKEKDYLFKACCDALDRLRSTFDVIVMEGAGSCAEVNLMDNDIVNLRMAAYADAPVVLVADIDRGGVFAQIVGTLACLAEERRDQIRGFIVNRFRGDIDLFRPGVDWIESKTAKPVFGVLPWYHDFAIEAEDAVVIDRRSLRRAVNADEPVIGIVRLPHISNFTDFDPLDDLHGVQVRYLEKPRPAANMKALVIPGTKCTRSDLEWLIRSGWAAEIQSFAQAGGQILGLCGGYQMLGLKVIDPDGIEGPAGSTPGLGLLPVETELKAPKTTTLTDFRWKGHAGSGYEIHMGITRLLDGQPLVRVTRRNGSAVEDRDGCTASDGRVMGSYIHGFFDTPEITRTWLDHIGLHTVTVGRLHGPAARDMAYSQLADHARRYLDVESILGLLRERSGGGAS